jgi:soluble lytic murein transglycosylase-like protein
MSDLWRSRYDSLFKCYGDLYGVRWELLKAQGIAESDLNPYAVSPVGALGLMQFMLPTWVSWGLGDRTNPEASIEAAAKYMQNLIKRFGDEKLALAAYNGGPTRLARIGYEAMPAESKNYAIKVLKLA